MQYGLSLPNGGVCGDARVLAELGWDGVFVEDYHLRAVKPLSSDMGIEGAFLFLGPGHRGPTCST